MIKRFSLALMVLLLATGCQMDLGTALDAGQDLVTAATLTPESAATLGKDAADQYDKQNKVAARNSKHGARLAKLTKNLTKEDGLNLNFKVYMVNDVNAFALPDGSIRVYSGLMDMMDDEELLFVIGHEIGHVKNEDSLDRFRMVYATSAARKGAASAGGTAAVLSDSQLGDLAEAFVHAQYSQSQELNADLYGFELLKKYKKNDAKAVSSLRKIAALGESGGILSSHPESGKRADTLESLRASNK